MWRWEGRGRRWGEGSCWFARFQTYAYARGIGRLHVPPPPQFASGGPCARRAPRPLLIPTLRIFYLHICIFNIKLKVSVFYLKLEWIYFRLVNSFYLLDALLNFGFYLSVFYFVGVYCEFGKKEHVLIYTYRLLKF